MQDYGKDSIALHAEHHGKLATQNKVALKTRRDLSLAYTPGVGEVCLEIAKNPARARDLTIKRNTVAVVSDGSAVLGLGNLGALGALPVMEGKAILFKEFAGIDSFPICLDTQDTEAIIATVRAIAPVFGGINLEDISSPRCFEIEERLQDLGIPVFHDDQHGTAIVVVGALLNALKLTGKDLSRARIVFNGSGAAAIACTRLLLKSAAQKLMPKPGDIILCDSKGIVHRGRGDLNAQKRALAEETNAAGLSGTLADALRGADVFIGLSQAGAVNQEMVRSMAKAPIVFAMANPVPEIMPDEAKAAGASVVGTGRSDFANQINNVLAFPGIFRGALDVDAPVINEQMKFAAAEALAGYVSDLTPERILPDPLDRQVATKVAEAVMKAARESGVARVKS